MRIFRVPKHFDFNCGPKWSIVAHYRGFGIGARHEYDHIRVMLLFWHIILTHNDQAQFRSEAT